MAHVWKALHGEVTERLGAASEGERTVFAAAVAERLLRAHEQLPAAEQRAYTLGQRGLLDAVWAGALGDRAAFRTVKHGLGTYYLSEHCHNDGPDGSDDADESAAAAVLYAALCHLHGCTDFAVFASGRALEAIDEVAQDDDDFADDPDELRAEDVRRQLRDLDLIADHAAELRHARFGLAAERTAELQTALRRPLSLADDLG
ncbi:hypothetical protein OG552_16885 [Streptomyces sp. NBC_01476]|uniref:hypothetical protein n=1 Tax=Streptomyces sp. NBC_01476 TaxID=2903881 RepID=UPI002E31E9A3|nr:hypothetical protein [Streptomyces sp. NBC_01476]